jgi:hypothetical protein
LPANQRGNLALVSHKRGITFRLRIVQGAWPEANKVKVKVETTTKAGDSQQNTADAPKSEQPSLSPEVVEKLGSWLNDVFSPLEDLPDVFRKSHAELITYMDRLVLLAGGTLTLTFSALGLISGHLNQLGRNAAYPGCIVAECWLLVVVIVLGLIHTRLRIRFQMERDAQSAIALMSMKAKLKMLANFPKVDISKLPEMDSKTSQETADAFAGIMRVCSITVHLSLTAAFVCLAIFIQSNVWLILTAGPK